MALTDDESAVLRTIAAQLDRDDPRLVTSLRDFTSAVHPPLRGTLLTLAALVAVLLVLAVALGNPAALVLAGTLAAVVPPGAWIARRRGWW
ncbi:DUF3040 domain-containing protein [Geodermatophilus sp. DF01-2]|uniref:DUF3040 domain-containing protein n=1 Tax=Geodermatophilus sp. DF01-2 TaxID=2559610 RepID=UPI0010732C85|nr:DUF3040 domain-containing protein [Geodermatophilus sp. DF01_2]TFV57704.1 DUF3040 domain-containing protein [Geodermatophilus sp. DF01_2]